MSHRVTRRNLLAVTAGGLAATTVPLGGASANDLTEGVLEGPSGNAVLNGVAVQVEAA